MIHNLPPNKSYFRVTTRRRKWQDVLSGNGALFLSRFGNRYNQIAQLTSYVSDNLEVAVTEFAYYAAIKWHYRISKYYLAPVRMPLQEDYLLWQFTLRVPAYVMDIENSSALPLRLPLFVLLNPGRRYHSTQ